MLAANYEGLGIQDRLGALVDDLHSLCRVRGLQWSAVVTPTLVSSELSHSPDHEQ